MLVMPPPSVPSRFSAGTLQPSKISSAIVDARMPIFGILGLVENPSKLRSTMKLVIRSSSFA